MPYCPEISSDTEVCLSEDSHCCGIQCSSPRKGGGSVYDGPAGGNPPMETSPLHYSTYLLPLSGSQTGEKDGSPVRWQGSVSFPDCVH